MVNLHLSGIILLKHPFLVYPVKQELYRAFAFDLHGRLAVFRAVEPGLRPPPYAGTVGIDGDKPLYVETAHVYVQVGQRVYDSGGGDGFVIAFFLLASSMTDRKIRCRRAR